MVRRAGLAAQSQSLLQITQKGFLGHILRKVQTDCLGGSFGLTPAKPIGMNNDIAADKIHHDEHQEYKTGDQMDASKQVVHRQPQRTTTNISANDKTVAVKNSKRPICRWRFEFNQR